MPNPNLPALSPAGARQLIAALTKLPPGDALRAGIAQAEAWQVQAAARHQDLAQRLNGGAHNLSRPVAIWNQTMADFRSALDKARSRLAAGGEPTQAQVAEVEVALGQQPKEGGSFQAAKNLPPAVAPTAGPNAKRSGLDAAALVLRESSQAMNVQEMLAQILERRLWTTGGKTPTATLYAAIIREIKAKVSEARFRKVDRGRFAAA